ncbi:MAG: PepSY domain-containing protein [Candidatus Electryoneaceae bacterium]|nr:PepSY domain-containing protein [Candidatus Electryoneaceae bacterium]
MMNSYTLRYALLLIALLSVVNSSPVFAVMKSHYEETIFAPPDLHKVIGPRSIETTEWSFSGNRVWQTFRYEDSGTIALATGSPVPIVSAIDFAYQHATEFGVDGCDLIIDQTRSVQSRSKGNALTVVLIKPMIEEIPIYGGYIVLTLNHNKELMVVKALGFGSQKYGSFGLDETEAITIARTFVNDHSGDAQIESVWLPRRTMDMRVELRSSYLVTLTPDNPQLRPDIFIDAETGELLASENRVLYDQLNGRTQGFYRPLYPRDDPVLGPFQYEWVRLMGGAQTYGDDDGEFSFEVNPDDGPFRLDSELRGHWVDVEYEDGPDATFRLNDVNADDDAVITWNDNNARVDELMLYFHTNFIHDFWKELDPDFDNLDYPMPAVCQVGDNYSNAYWNGYGMYFGGGGGDGPNAGRNFAMYPDIIRHEYGHGVTGHIYPRDLMPYRDEPGALNEAWSDYFPCSISDDPLMGEDSNGGGYIRNLDNNLHYPEDIRNEVHADSRLISAALWHTREILGRDYCDDLFHFTRYEFGNTFITYFVDILATDDDDGDITNGTPNYEVLYEQFGRHGIGPGVFPKIAITRIELSDDRQNGANGNDDRLWEAGETIRLEMDIHRDGTLYPPPAENVRIQLRSDHPGIQLVRAEVSYGDIFVGDRVEAEQPLLFQIDENAPISFANFFLDIIAGDDDDILLQDTIRIPVGVPPILLVSDGEAGHNSSNVPMSWWFESSLSELSQVYAKFATISPVRPLDEWLDRFETVIWFTGDAVENILNEDDRDLLAQFMDDGGNVC